jgi:hypothetical protein
MGRHSHGARHGELLGLKRTNVNSDKSSLEIRWSQRRFSESYVCETGTSMKAVEFARIHKDCWRKIASLTMSARVKHFSSALLHALKEEPTQWTGANSDIYVYRSTVPILRARSSPPASTSRRECSLPTASGWPLYLMIAAAMKCMSSLSAAKVCAAWSPRVAECVPCGATTASTCMYSAGDAVLQVVFDPVTGSIGQAAVPVRLPPRAAVFGVSPDGEFIGVRNLAESLSASELEVASEWFREVRARVPNSH